MRCSPASTDELDRVAPTGQDGRAKVYAPLTNDSTALLVVDLQEKLMRVVSNAGEVERNSEILVRLSEIVVMPRIVTTQYAKGIGPVVAPLRDALRPDERVFDKTEFSCLANAQISSSLEGLGRRRLIVAGVEAHICVYQTAVAARAAGYDVTVAADAVGSRAPANHALGLERLRELGAHVVPTETIVYEILGRAGTPEFKAMLPHLK